MDVLILLDKLDDLIYSSKPIPLTDQVRVEREEAYSLLDQIRVTLPEEIKQARWIVKERQDEAQSQKRQPSEPESPHLQEIMSSIEELKRSQRPAPPPLTAAAADKVRSIVEAAEASAAEVRAEAEREARRIEGDAARRGMEMRKRSAAEAAARLKRADEVTAALLAEAASASANIDDLLDRVRGPAAALADVLGEGAGKVQADFARMRARVTEAPVGDDWASPADPSGEIRASRDVGAKREAEAAPAESHESEPEPDLVSQPTEEWSYEEAISGEDERDESAIHASLPGADAKVAAGRLDGADGESSDVENDVADDAREDEEPELSGTAAQGRRFDRPRAPQHARQ